MTVTESGKVELGYGINDADNHFEEPASLYSRYIDPKLADLAIREVTAPDGTTVLLHAGQPSKFSAKHILGSPEEVAALVGNVNDADAPGEPQLKTIPGQLLNKLNPLKGLSEEERKAVVQSFRNQQEAFGNRDLRLRLMDDQGIDKAMMFPNMTLHIEYELAENIPALYANLRAYNRWIAEEIGFNVQNRVFFPPYISLAEPDLALRELEQIIDAGARMLEINGGHAHGGAANPLGGRSPADPIYDRFWSTVNDAGMRLVSHLSSTDYAKYGADWSEDPNTPFGDFNAFQWMQYWGDRPAIDLTSSLILQNFFGRYPNIRVLLSEMGTVWLSYTLRKCDHAFFMGRKASFSHTGRLDRRPSEIFREHFVVAPYPEENVERVVADVGIEPIVFGSDFPHGEGLAYPAGYVAAQLSKFSEADQRRIMRDTMESFFAPCLK